MRDPRPGLPPSPARRRHGVLLAVALLLATGAAPAATLLPYEVVEDAIPRPLTDKPGDPQRGRAIALDRSKGNCVTCHEMPLRADFQGNLGPPLAGVGGRYNAGELRLRLVDSKRINPESNMPAYYKVEGLRDVRREFAGKPILEAQEVEDVLAFLLTLK
ncbi:sulfur oxidation c-type cytochrome SoxX [Roseicella aerolata]|uniref:Sulfur oxidation c-type cytochrome SoxX n=1 Tax=Roseicella aerolata TaxID=2883479 RepID=A0A9X1IFS2_9PROT|nr:sulfur oxidation c-type cytochrome SoxX [Roseicella aerolata]MCB4823737.1 sulfur oxidation c-type cytochrome SoxX [Roseicella aerolata]